MSSDGNVVPRGGEHLDGRNTVTVGDTVGTDGRDPLIVPVPVRA
jgi:hypothetical protein